MNSVMAAGEMARAAVVAQRDPWGQARVWWQRILRLSRRPPRRLRLCETLALGERRFLAVVEFEQARFLVGGTSASLVLLATLAPAPTTKEPIGMSTEEQR
jgi:flagellar biogenesis protein FliO